MPIDCPQHIRDLSQSQFDAIDRTVMGCAFDSQNELGRLCDEMVYENDVALRLRQAGHGVQTQVPIIVTHDTFQKRYRLDLVCDNAVYDGKMVAAFTGEHDAQVLNYAMLLNIRHIKLLNFRTPKVLGRLRYNAVTREQRYQYELDTSGWKSLTASCDRLRAIVGELVEDWGAFLNAILYQEALVHFHGGRDACEHRINVTRDGHELGTHRIHVHAPEHFFVTTALTKDTPAYGRQLRQVLRLTGMRGIQWINFNHHRIEFRTIE